MKGCFYDEPDPTIGHRILDFIIEHGLAWIEDDDPNAIVWSGNAPEQIEALVNEWHRDKLLIECKDGE